MVEDVLARGECEVSEIQRWEWHMVEDAFVRGECEVSEIGCKVGKEISEDKDNEVRDQEGTMLWTVRL